MRAKNNLCCQTSKNNSPRGILSGVFFGLIPHAFCIAFILFSVLGAVGATAVVKKFLLFPYFFHFLILVSLLLATLSSAVYLKKNYCLCVAGVKNKWRYVTTLYSATILVNLLMFFVVFPALANISPKNATDTTANLADLSLSVQIPCSGHAPLIIDELKKENGVSSIAFQLPNIFKIQYDSQKTSPEKITALEIFKTYKATTR